MSDFYDRHGMPISMERWAQLFEAPGDRIVRKTDMGTFLGTVSTVWLGIDHSWGRGEKPVIFETMIFGGPLDGEMGRYCTVEEATAGHEAWVAQLTELGKFAEEAGESIRALSEGPARGKPVLDHGRKPRNHS